MGLDMFLYSYHEKDKRDYKDREYWIEWRKANAIHRWFVMEIQGGVDEWGEYPVPREKLVELLELCERAYASDRVEASKILPAMRGPFFGSTDYGELYYWALKQTVTQLKALLDTRESKLVHFYYQASW